MFLRRRTDALRGLRPPRSNEGYGKWKATALLTLALLRVGEGPWASAKSSLGKAKAGVTGVSRAPRQRARRGLCERGTVRKPPLRRLGRARRRPVARPDEPGRGSARLVEREPRSVAILDELTLNL